ncbi:MAG: VacB/RNase II family 3'-5' exoribonuclease, partial [Bacteroidales bacterium]|nr:VacB/RNase II family 3'-5' exoribonuclease [Candidatus Cryptobacteroides equifaecalis]
MRRKDFNKSKRRSGRGARAKSYPEVTGRVQMSREGFIYVIPESPEEADVFVRAAKTRNALNGDIVKVAVTQPGTESRRREGEVVQIVERSKKPFVGILHFVGNQAWVLMQSKSMPYDIEVDREAVAAAGGESGMKVAAVVDRWDRRDPSPVGHVVDVLGAPGANDTEMHAILAEFDLPYRFEKEVEDAADKISEKITSADMEGRRDFRDVFTFTIDPADAKDFDDALSFRKLPGGNFEVGVHIADVSWYVTPGTVVDKEAQARGTSVYLVDRTVPMLPEKLCNKLCSLRPHEDKLTFSAVFEMTPEAKVVKYWLGRTAICSDFRLDYAEAQNIIEAEVLTDSASLENMANAPQSQSETSAKEEQLREAIVVLNGMAAKLKQARFKAGAIDFDRPEMKVLVDEEGRPVDVYEKRSKEANWLIEEFMLLANRTVAEFVARKNKVFVYRVHGEPNPAKLEILRNFSKGFGYKMGESGDGKAAARSISKLLDKAMGKPEFSAFEDMALGSMANASYSTDNIGHYGLAFKYYTHFTSPIRRYPDLMVQRLLALYLGAPSPVPASVAEGQMALA